MLGPEVQAGWKLCAASQRSRNLLSPKQALPH